MPLSNSGPSTTCHRAGWPPRPTRRWRNDPSRAPTRPSAIRIPARNHGCNALRIGEHTTWWTRAPGRPSSSIAATYEKWMSPDSTVTVAGGRSRAVTSRSSSTIAVNERSNAAQSSRSSARRSRSPRRAARSPSAPSHTASLHCWKPCNPPGTKTGSELASSRWRTSSWAHCSTTQPHSSSSSIARDPGSSVRPLRASITTSSVSPRWRTKLNG